LDPSRFILSCSLYSQIANTGGTISAYNIILGPAALQQVETELEDTKDSNQWKVIQSV